MPLMADLSKVAQRWWRKRDITMESAFGSDFESLLTYLYQEMPWKTSPDMHKDLAAYHAVTQDIAGYLGDQESAAWSEIDETSTGWPSHFAAYLHAVGGTIVTLNYDTLLERMLGREGKRLGVPTNVGGLYRLPLVHIGMRGAGSRGILGPVCAPDNITVLKPHGSTNWFVSEDGWDLGGQAYYCEVDECGSRDAIACTQDLMPLIIPPVADKSRFYNARLIRAIWRSFETAFLAADEVYCIGYSLPQSDLTMRLFFRGAVSARGKTVYLVNNASKKAKNDLLHNYKEVFRGAKIDGRYLGRDDAVETMVNDLVAGDCGDTDVG
jgi:hypothetical protein